MAYDTNTKPVRIYTDGVFDMLHAGHSNFFTQAIAKAQEMFKERTINLVVGVCGDGVDKYKRATIMSLDERCASVRAHKLVHEVIKNCPLQSTVEFLNENSIDLLIHGDDFKPEKKMQYFGHVIALGKFAEVKYTPGVSTTQLLIEIKTKDKINASLDLTLIDKNELIRRVKERSWESLNIPQPKE